MKIRYIYINLNQHEKHQLKFNLINRCRNQLKILELSPYATLRNACLTPDTAIVAAETKLSQPPRIYRARSPAIRVITYSENAPGRKKDTPKGVLKEGSTWCIAAGLKQPAAKRKQCAVAGLAGQSISSHKKNLFPITRQEIGSSQDDYTASSIICL
jgi:hypothetical protein